MVVSTACDADSGTGIPVVRLPAPRTLDVDVRVESLSNRLEGDCDVGKPSEQPSVVSGLGHSSWRPHSAWLERAGRPAAPLVGLSWNTAAIWFYRPPLATHHAVRGRVDDGRCQPRCRQGDGDRTPIRRHRHMVRADIGETDHRVDRAGAEEGCALAEER